MFIVLKQVDLNKLVNISEIVNFVTNVIKDLLFIVTLKYQKTLI